MLPSIIKDLSQNNANNTTHISTGALGCARAGKKMNITGLCV